MSKNIDPKILVALDYDDPQAAISLAKQLNPQDCRLKVGKELFTTAGPALVAALHELEFEIFLDLKFHDIPATVGKAVKAAANLGVWMVNVHACGGRRMMEAAKEALSQVNQPPKLIAVTVLTSMEQADLEEVGVTASLDEQVLSLATLSQDVGLDGVVCSAQEAVILRKSRGADFLLVTPGIRPLSAAQDDQRRIVTPVKALQNGSDYLVIGRPITRAINPAEACREIAREIQKELSN